MPVVTEVVGDLTFQRRLQQPLRQLLQHPTLAGELQTARLGPVDQLVNRVCQTNGVVPTGGLVVCIESETEARERIGQKKVTDCFMSRQRDHGTMPSC